MKKTIFLYAFFSIYLFGQHSLQLIDPLFHLQLQSLKFNQELDIYKESNPWIKISQAQKYYPIKETQTNIRLLPQVLFAENSTDHQFGMWATATLDKITMMADARLVQAEHNIDYFGSEYSRSGINGRVNTAFVRFENNRYLAQFGRAPVFWGSSINNSIIQSGLAPSYDHFDGKINIGDFTVEVLGGQLGSEYLSDETRIKRYISGHQFNWLSGNKSLLIGAGEQIIYTGQNRSLEWVYLNPFVPYVFTAFDKDEEPTGSGDNDNSIIFGYFRYNVKPNISVYSEMIIDDYQLDDTDRQSALGINIGFDWGAHIFNKPATGTFSYTQVDSWSYSAAFINRLFDHLRLLSIPLNEVSVQSDNGSEFPRNGLDLTKPSAFEKAIMDVKANYIRIPPGAKNHQSDVERANGLIEYELLEIERWRGQKVN